MGHGTFDVWQQTFTLSMLVSSDEIGPALRGGGLRDLIGSGWELAWGPRTFAAPGADASRGSLCVAHDPRRRLYVVVVAASNVNTLLALDDASEDVRPVAWPYGGTACPGARIAAVVRDGVDTLLSLESRGKTLQAFLASRSDAAASTLVWTGHGLGGALASTLALVLEGQGVGPSSFRAVHVYPTGAPAAGNSIFAASFAWAFPRTATGPRPWQVWNVDLANRLDIVPRAWNAQSLATIPDLYQPAVKSSFAFHLAAGGKVLQVLAFGYTRIGATDLPGSAVQGAGDKFAQEARYQHRDAYFALLRARALLALPGTTGEPLFQPAGRFAALAI